MKKRLYSIIESPNFPDTNSLVKKLNLEETKINSMRKALAQIKKQAPDIILAEFFYGFGNNYAGVNISNLDVMLYSLQKYANQVKVIVLVEKGEQQYVQKLNEIYPLSAVLVHPVGSAQLEQSLQQVMQE